MWVLHASIKRMNEWELARARNRSTECEREWTEREWMNDNDAVYQIDRKACSCHLSLSPFRVFTFYLLYIRGFSGASIYSPFYISNIHADTETAMWIIRTSACTDVQVARASTISHVFFGYTRSPIYNLTQTLLYIRTFKYVNIRVYITLNHSPWGVHTWPWCKGTTPESVMKADYTRLFIICVIPAIKKPEIYRKKMDLFDLNTVCFNQTKFISINNISGSIYNWAITFSIRDFIHSPRSMWETI